MCVCGGGSGKARDRQRTMLQGSGDLCRHNHRQNLGFSSREVESQVEWRQRCTEQSRERERREQPDPEVGTEAEGEVDFMCLRAKHWMHFKIPWGAFRTDCESRI